MYHSCGISVVKCAPAWQKPVETEMFIESTSAGKNPKNCWFWLKIFLLLIILTYIRSVAEAHVIDYSRCSRKASHHGWLATVRLLDLAFVVILLPRILIPSTKTSSGVGMSVTTTLVTANRNMNLCLGGVWRQLARCESSGHSGALFGAMSNQGRRGRHHDWLTLRLPFVVTFFSPICMVLLVLYTSQHLALSLSLYNVNQLDHDEDDQTDHWSLPTSSV